MFDELFESINIGKLTLDNRFIVPAMDSHYTNNEHYFIEQAANYYAARARGGFSLIFTEFLCVSEEGLSNLDQAGIYDDKFLPGMINITDRVHQNGGKIFAQLQHAGRLADEKATNLQAVGASNIPAAGKMRKVHELTIEEVGVMIEKFVAAAKRAQKAGFDGIEIHGAHGYLLAQFLSKGVNRRADKYGGNITNRARIIIEIIKRVKQECGQDFPISVRTSGDEAYYGGNTIEDAVAQAILFEKAGADVMNISYGIAIQSTQSDPGFNISNVKKVKEALNIPVICVGRINDPALALSIVRSNSADLVALGRQSISDPDFPNKVKEDRINEIFTCTGCLQRCLYSDSFEEGFGTSCMANPFSGKEGQWEIEKTNTPKNITVVGAGVAGLQAGWILAKKGHHVTIAEKDSVPGGQYRLASVPPMKQDLAKTVETYETLCLKHNATIEYNTTVDNQYLQQRNPDTIIVATGSTPIVPPIKGINNANVYKANEVLKFDVLLNNKKILILGAGLVGAETAEQLSVFNNQVTIVDMLEKIAPIAPRRTREALIKQLDNHGVRAILNSKVIEILDDGIIYETNGQQKSITGFDAIVIAFGTKANNELFEQINMQFANVYRIGDALTPGDAQKGIFEATKLALTL